MAKNIAKVIPDILEEHFEEFDFLWGQRQQALRSPEYTFQEFLELENRIQAHLQGLLVGAENTIDFVEEGLDQEDPNQAFAAAYTLLRLNIPTAAQKVADAFLKAKGTQLKGITQALCHGPIDMVIDRIKEALTSEPPPVAVSAAQALTFHTKLDTRTDRLKEFFTDDNAQVRQTAWRLVMLDSNSWQVSPYIFTLLSEAVMHDQDPAVRLQAMWTAAWTQQTWLLDHCRKLTAEPSPENFDAIELLAILGKPSDIERILATANAAKLGAQRFRLLSAFGHPGVVETLLKAIESEDPVTAAAAGAAFTSITGVDIESDNVAQVPPPDGSEPDEFEQEFLDEVSLPSPQSAQEHWQKVKGQFSKGTRWGCGLNLSMPISNEVMAQLNLESRWHACLRGRFEGTWQGSLINLEVFPQ